MQLQDQKKLTANILRLLKVNYIDFPIGRTNKGNLALRFSDNGDFEMLLDSVPLSTKDSLQDENNIELKRMFEKYWFDSTSSPIATTVIEWKGRETNIPLNIKKRGRPAGSKNKDVKKTHKETA